jgi:hypothetical protein
VGFDFPILIFRKIDVSLSSLSPTVRSLVSRVFERGTKRPKLAILQTIVLQFCKSDLWPPTMAIPNNTEGAWSQYTTAHSSPYADFSDSASGLLTRHEGEYGAPPTYFPHPQETSYHHLDIRNGTTHHSTERRSYPRGPSRPPKTTYGAMKSPFRHSLFHVFCTVLVTVVFAVTSWFAQATFSANSTAEATNILNAIHISFGSTIAVLRFLQGLTSTCIIIVLNQAFERIQWSLASSEYGIRLLSLLSLSPATSLYGIFGIAFGRRASILDRIWALLRRVTLRPSLKINYQAC